MRYAISLLAGVLLGLMSARPTQAGWLWAAAFAVTVVCLTPLRRVPAFGCLAALLGGMSLAGASIVHWQQLRVLPGAAASRVLLEATITNVPARRGTEIRFDADVRLVHGGRVGDDRPRRARIAWRDPPVMPRAGERWRLLARLIPAAESHNFDGFDGPRMAFRDRVHLTARVLPAAINTRLALADAGVDTLRARIATRICGAVADPDAAALISALAVGLTAGMSADQWRVFNATGTTHLVAISGLHVTLFALLAFGGARRLWRWLPAAQRLAREPFALAAGLAAAFAYSLLAGFSVPTQRTWLMLALFVLARLAARPLVAARAWSLALAAVLLLDVRAPLAAGFWLSFVAVGVILLRESSSLAAPRRRVFQVFGLQLAIMLALAPLTLAIFGGISLVGLAANLVAIPVVSFVFVPLVLAGALAAWWFPPFDAVLFGLAAKLYALLWPGLVWAADREYACWRFDPAAWWLALALPAALLLLRSWPPALRICAAACALPLLFAPVRAPQFAGVWVKVLDTGRGSAVLLATRRHVLLYDTGDGWNTHGARVVALIGPALDALGRARLDTLVLPRLTPDRAWGAATLAFERDVRRLLVGGGWPGTSLPAQRCGDGEFTWDGVRFETFAAGRERDSCVLRVSAGERALLLGGDLDAAGEHELMARLGARRFASDVVVLSRQAGAAGSVVKWIDSIRARLVIATGGVAGSDARRITLERWRRAGARVLDTRELGAIEFAFGTHGVDALAAARLARYPFAWRRIE